MKKLIVTLFMISLALAATGCENINTTPTEPVTELHSTTTETTQPTTELKVLEHLELKANELPLDSKWLSDDLEKVGLARTNKPIRESGFITEQSKIAKNIQTVALLRDFERYGDAVFHDLFLAVETDTKVIFKDLTFNRIPGAYSEKLYLNDIDGDGIDEIILHQCVGMSGGAGSYLARVFKIKNEEIKEIFCSSTDDSKKYWDTGFSGHPEDNYTFIIANNITGYYEEYKVGADRPDRHDENGKAVSHREIMVDSFNMFLPKDIDNDGTCEIYCRQYTSDWGHADYIGNAVSVLKYNAEKQDFEVTDAWFEPIDEFK